MRWIAIVSSSFLVALADPLPAAAQGSTSRSAEPRERTALRLGHDALELYQAGRYNEAYAQFAAAERLAHSPVFVLFMARCRIETGKLLAARTLFGQVARESVPADAPEAWRRAVADARAELESLRAEVPKLKLQIRGASGTPAVRIDGASVAAAKLAGAIELDPGAHWISARDERGREVTRSFDLEQGSGEVVVELEFPAPVAPAAAAAAPAPSRDADSSSAAWRFAGFALLGLGAAGIGLGATAGVIAQNEAGEIKENCIDGHCLATDAGKRDEANRWADWSTAGFVAGGASVVAGGAILLLAPGRSRQAGVAPLWLHCGLGELSVHGRF